MNPIRPGLFVDRGLMWTRNRVPGKKVYDEPLRLERGVEYRAWNPGRSKLSAYARNRGKQWVPGKKDVLYLGAANGTTVSHVSDMLEGNARVFAVEFSARSMRDLLFDLSARDNVIPILEDAGAPTRYAAYIDRPVGCLIQDVAQRHQVEIFLRNMPFVAPGGLGFLFIKARSIHVSRPVKEIYADVARKLKEAGLDIVDEVDLEPFEHDHRAFVVKAP